MAGRARLERFMADRIPGRANEPPPPPPPPPPRSKGVPQVSKSDAEKGRLVRLLSALSRAAEPIVQLAFAGKLTDADACRLTSGALLDEIVRNGSTSGNGDSALLAESLIEDENRSKFVQRQLELDDWPPAFSEAYCRRTRGLLRDVYVQRAAYALFTTQWQASLAQYLTKQLKAERVLKVCCGRNLLTAPMNQLGIDWCASDVRMPPIFDRAADVSGPAAATRDEAMVDAFCSDGSSSYKTAEAPAYASSSTATIEVCGALDVVKVRLKAGDVDVVFYSWWPPDDEKEEDYLLACACMEAGVPLLLVGESRGGCTGSDRFWSGRLPIRRLAEVVAEGSAQAGAEFVDVAQWDGCGDLTWCVLPKQLPN